MKILILSLYIAVFLLFSQLFFFRFRPTRRWWVRKLRLYKIFPNAFQNIEDVEEILTQVNTLIIYRCSDENKIINETRNGYVLKYFPEGVDKNKRIWDFNYVEIFDDFTNATLYVGFDANNIPKYQIEYQQNYASFLRIFYKQEKCLDPEECFSTSDGRCRVIKNYRDYVMKDIL